MKQILLGVAIGYIFHDYIDEILKKGKETLDEKVEQAQTDQEVAS